MGGSLGFEVGRRGSLSGFLRWWRWWLAHSVWLKPRWWFGGPTLSLHDQAD
jgi:hypothetical protein